MTKDKWEPDPSHSEIEKRLTSKQEAFCLGVVSGFNLSDAYRRAGYSCRNMKTVNEAASRLSKNSKVAARIDFLRKPIIERAQITLEAHLGILEVIRDKSIEKSRFSVAIEAQVEIGKAAGLYRT